MKKLLKSIFSLACVGVLAGIWMGLSTVSASAAADKDYGVKEDSYYQYVQDFTDPDAVNADFSAFYRENALGSAQLELVGTNGSATDTHWYIDGGVLKRINGVEQGADTNRVAILTFTKEAYVNFEMSVDYKAGPTGFWPVIGIRQLEAGKYYLDDGAGVFVQQSGIVTLWGDPAVQGPHNLSSIPGYKATEWHTMQIKALGNTLSVSIDNQPWIEKGLSADFYDLGYVSLISVNNETEYRNFRIKALAEPENVPIELFDPVAEADTDDALSKLAGEVKDKDTLFERADKVNSDVVSEDKKSGCKGSIAGVSVPLVLAAVGIVSIKKKNDPKD